MRCVILKKILTVGLALTLWLGPVPTAQAQYFQSWPYYLGMSLLRPLSRLSSFGRSGTRNYNYYPYNNNTYTDPYYLSNSVLNRAVPRNGIIGGASHGPMNMIDYTDAESTKEPRHRLRPFRYGQFGVDQIASASSYKKSIQPNQFANLQGRSDLGRQQNKTSRANGVLPTVQPDADGMPPLAPQKAPYSLPITKNSQSSVEQIAEKPNLLKAAPSPGSSAQEFVNLVNGKYGADISKALFSADGRAVARSIGFVDHDDIFAADFSQKRVNIIAKIFQADEVDGLSKLEAARIILRNGNSNSR